VSKADLDIVPPKRDQPSYTWGQMPYNFRFEQGTHRDYDIGQYVAVERGNPVVTVRNLPQGATFDGKTLAWTPPCGKDPDFYKLGIGEQTLIFTLKSDDGSADFVERDANLFVYEFDEKHNIHACGEAP
jgi:hypothetical protein